MKLNEYIAISTPRVLLVPYEARHVPRYHEWMEDEEIQHLTASEPLSLEDEYENQLSWRTAHDKLTFILCRPVEKGEGEGNDVRAGVDDDEGRMIGDINFFIYPDDDGEDDEESPARQDGVMYCYGEVDVMVAEKGERGQGRGEGAVRALLRYLTGNLERLVEEYREGMAVQGPKEVRLTRLVAKIKEGNQRSRRLFERLGFVQRGEVNYFGEVEMGVEFEGMEVEVEGYRETKYVRE